MTIFLKISYCNYINKIYEPIEIGTGRCDGADFIPNDEYALKYHDDHIRDCMIRCFLKHNVLSFSVRDVPTISGSMCHCSVDSNDCEKVYTSVDHTRYFAHKNNNEIIPIPQHDACKKNLEKYCAENCATFNENLGFSIDYVSGKCRCSEKTVRSCWEMDEIEKKQHVLSYEFRDIKHLEHLPEWNRVCANCFTDMLCTPFLNSTLQLPGNLPDEGQKYSNCPSILPFDYSCVEYKCGNKICSYVGPKKNGSIIFENIIGKDLDMVESFFKGRISDINAFTAKLKGTKFMKGSVIENVIFNGTNVERTIFDGVVFKNVTFTGALLSGAVFDHAIFDGVVFNNVELNGVKFTMVNFDTTSITVEYNATITTEFYGCSGIPFSNPHFSAQFVLCTTPDGQPYTRLNGYVNVAGSFPTCNGIEMKAGANFSSVNNFRNCDFTNIDLWGATFAGRDLSNMDFSGSNLMGVDFSNTNLKNVKFAQVQTLDAIFENTTGQTSICPTKMYAPYLCIRDEIWNSQFLTNQSLYIPLRDGGEEQCTRVSDKYDSSDINQHAHKFKHYENNIAISYHGEDIVCSEHHDGTGLPVPQGYSHCTSGQECSDTVKRVYELVLDFNNQLQRNSWRLPTDDEVKTACLNFCTQQGIFTGYDLELNQGRCYCTTKKAYSSRTDTLVPFDWSTYNISGSTFTDVYPGPTYQLRKYVTKPSVHGEEYYGEKYYMFYETGSVDTGDFKKIHSKFLDCGAKLLPEGYRCLHNTILFGPNMNMSNIDVTGLNFTDLSGSGTIFYNNKGKALNCPLDMKQGNNKTYGVFCIDGYFFGHGTRHDLTFLPDISSADLNGVLEILQYNISRLSWLLRPGKNPLEDIELNKIYGLLALDNYIGYKCSFFGLVPGKVVKNGVMCINIKRSGNYIGILVGPNMNWKNIHDEWDKCEYCDTHPYSNLDWSDLNFSNVDLSNSNFYNARMENVRVKEDVVLSNTKGITSLQGSELLNINGLDLSSLEIYDLADISVPLEEKIVCPIFGGSSGHCQWKENTCQTMDDVFDFFWVNFCPQLRKNECESKKLPYKDNNDVWKDYLTEGGNKMWCSAGILFYDNMDLTGFNLTGADLRTVDINVFEKFKGILELTGCTAWLPDGWTCTNNKLRNVVETLNSVNPIDCCRDFDMSGVYLSDITTEQTDRDFTNTKWKRAHGNAVNFQSATLSPEYKVFKLISADTTGSHVLLGPGVIIKNRDLTDLNITGTNINGTTLTGSTMSWRADNNANEIVGCPSELPTHYSCLVKDNSAHSVYSYNEIIVVGPYMDLSGMSLKDYNFTGVSLEGAFLRGVSGKLKGCPAKLPTNWGCNDQDRVLLGPGAHLFDVTLTNVTTKPPWKGRTASCPETSNPIIHTLCIQDELIAPTGTILLENVDFNNANFTRFDLTRFTFNQCFGKLSECPQTLPNGYKCEQKHIIGPNSNLDGTNMTGWNISGISLAGSHMKGAYGILAECPSHGGGYKCINNQIVGLGAIFSVSLVGQTISGISFEEYDNVDYVNFSSTGGRVSTCFDHVAGNTYRCKNYYVYGPNIDISGRDMSGIPIYSEWDMGGSTGMVSGCPTFTQFDSAKCIGGHIFSPGRIIKGGPDIFYNENLSGTNLTNMNLEQADLSRLDNMDKSFGRLAACPRQLPDGYKCVDNCIVGLGAFGWDDNPPSSGSYNLTDMHLERMSINTDIMNITNTQLDKVNLKGNIQYEGVTGTITYNSTCPSNVQCIHDGDYKHIIHSNMEMVVR